MENKGLSLFRLIGMNHNRILLFVSLLVFSFGTSTELAAQYNLKWMDGYWSGIGYQINMSTTWPVELIVRSEEGHFFISYPNINCEGNWLLKEAGERHAIFIEEIEVGKDRCVQGGQLVITLVDDNHITYSYFSPDGDLLEAFSTLERLEHRNKRGSKRT